MAAASGAAAGAVLSSTARAQKSGVGRPNLLLIVAEDMGPQIGCYGDRTVPTPHLDRLAGEGVLFENAYVTQASCSPSRSSILTGLYPHRNFQLGLAHLGYRMHRGIPSLPQALKRQGYRTGIQGKLHVNPEGGFPFDVRGNRHSKDIPAYAESADAFLKERGDTPFFLYVNFGDCHKPFVAQVKGLPEKPVTASEIRLFREHGELDTPAVREETAGYYNSVQRVDIGVGLLLDLLSKHGVADNTLVVFIGDHGPPMSRGKTTTYEFGVKIPMILRWPGQSRAGVRSDALVSTVDLMPTLLDAAGAACPTPIDGMSLRPLLKVGAAAWRDTVCTEWHTHGPGFAPQRTIRDKRYKLILNLRTDIAKPGIGVDGCKVGGALKDPKFEGTQAKRVFDLLESPPAVELYDLQNDPIEYHNLAGQAESADVQGRLMKQLQTWREQTRDPFLDSEVFEAHKRHFDQYVAELPERRKKVKPDRQGRRRVLIDMSLFQRDWADVLAETK